MISINKLHLIKYYIEKISGWKLWLSKPESDENVLRLLRGMAPQMPEKGFIRVGPETDGGYVVPNELEGLAGCISPGVSNEIRFDLEIAERGVDVLLADNSIEKLPENHQRFIFRPLHLDVIESESTTTLKSLVNEFPEGDLILQMDIESAEWNIIIATDAEILNRFRIMIIEFHGMRRIFSKECFSQIDSCFRKLLDTHNIVHIHPNNVSYVTKFRGVEMPDIVEITFLRKDRGFETNSEPAIPNELDIDCSTLHETTNLQHFWKL